MFSIIVFLESLDRSEGDALTMANRAFIYIFFYFFPYFLWFELDSIDYLTAITAVKCYITTFRIECVFTFLSERGNIYEICIWCRHGYELKITSFRYGYKTMSMSSSISKPREKQDKQKSRTILLIQECFSVFYYTYQ